MLRPLPHLSPVPLPPAAQVLADSLLEGAAPGSAHLSPAERQGKLREILTHLQAYSSPGNPQMNLSRGWWVVGCGWSVGCGHKGQAGEPYGARVPCSGASCLSAAYVSALPRLGSLLLTFLW